MPKTEQAVPVEINIVGGDAKRYAVIDADSRVLNVVMWDGNTDYDPGDGLDLVEYGDKPCNLGDVIDRKTLNVVRPAEALDVPREPAAVLSDLVALLVDRGALTEKDAAVLTGSDDATVDGAAVQAK